MERGSYYSSHPLSLYPPPPQSHSIYFSARVGTQLSNKYLPASKHSIAKHNIANNMLCSTHNVVGDLYHLYACYKRVALSSKQNARDLRVQRQPPNSFPYTLIKCVIILRFVVRGNYIDDMAHAAHLFASLLSADVWWHICCLLA